MKKTLYLDHNIIADGVHHGDIRRVIEEHNLKLVLSEVNFLELVRVPDEYLEDLKSKIKFLEKLEPKFIATSAEIKSDEICRFITTNFLGYEFHPLNIFHNTLGDLVNEKDLNSLHRYIFELRKPEIQTMLQQIIKESAKSLQQARNEPEAFSQQLNSDQSKKEFIYLNLNLNLEKVDKKRIFEKLDDCLKQWSELMAECKTLAVDDKLSNFRTRDKGRKVKESDLPDYQHILAALPYCDYFLSNDKYVVLCTKELRKNLSDISLAKVFKTPKDLLIFLQNR